MCIRDRLRPLRNRISRLEKDMDSAQRELKALTTRLEEPSLYAGGGETAVQELLREQATLQKKLAAAEEAWLFACEELEQLESGASDG